MEVRKEISYFLNGNLPCHTRNMHMLSWTCLLVLPSVGLVEYALGVFFADFILILFWGFFYGPIHQNALLYFKITGLLMTLQ